MSDLETPDDEQSPEDNAVIRELREKAKRADAAEADAQAAKRELTLHKAGLGGLSEKQTKALLSTHDGDWEPESLKATATELGFLQQPEAGQEQIPQGELETHQRVAAAAGGTPPPPAEARAEIDAAKTPEELVAVLARHGMLAPSGD